MEIKKTKIRALDKIVLRTPLFSNSCAFENVINNPFFLLALFIASPELYERYSKTPHSHKVVKSVYKYYLRSIYRCTPFGLFSGVSLLDISSNTDVLLDEIDNGSISVRLNHKCSDVSINKIDLMTITDIPNLQLSVNPLLYYFEDTIRFPIVINDDLIIRSISKDEILEDVINFIKNGFSVRDLVEHLLKKDFDIRDVKEYIYSLVTEKILLNLNEYYLPICVFGNLENDNKLNEGVIKKDIYCFLKSLCKKNLDLRLNPDTFYEMHKEILENLFFNYDKKPIDSIFNVDYYRKTKVAFLDKKVVAKLKKILPLFSKSNIFEFKDRKLESFIKQFTCKYGSASVPFLLALDIELGVPYLQIKKCDSEVYGDVCSSNLKLNLSQDLPFFTLFLIRKSYECLSGNDNVIFLNDSDLGNIEPDYSSFPKTFSVMFQLLENDDILLKGIGSSTAISLLNRFSSFPAIEKFCEEISSYDQCDDEIVAEIIYYPYEQVRNVLDIASENYKYKIALSPLIKSSVNIIHLSELWISVTNGEILLTYGETGKRVRPILTNSHCFSNDLLPHYRFLCDLQVNFSYYGYFFCYNEALKVLRHMPRVVFNGCIISRECWCLDIKSFEGDIDSWLIKYKIPCLFLLTQGDMELLIDIHNDVSFEIFMDFFTKNKTVFIKEFIKSSNLIQSENDIYNNEMIISFYKYYH